MANENTTESAPTKKRLSLGDSRAARNSLCKLMRLRYNKQIDSALFRDLVYGFNTLLGIDKHILESDLNKRIEQLERLVSGEAGSPVQPSDIESPYALDLKRQLENERKINEELNKEVLNMKRQFPRGVNLDC